MLGGLLKRKGKLVVSNKAELKDEHTDYFHSTSTASHFGVHSTKIDLLLPFIGKEWVRTSRRE